jgi:tetratricopeptide (TPR) repeat protein
LTKFSESKGVTVEFQGGLFAANIKLQQLYEKNELKSIENLEKIINEILPGCFDYAITVEDPRQLQSQLQHLWRIWHHVTITVNNNFNNVETILLNTLKGISMTDDDKKSYDNSGKQYFEVQFQTSKKIEKIWVRNGRSRGTLGDISRLIKSMLFSCKVNNNVFFVEFKVSPFKVVINSNCKGVLFRHGENAQCEIDSSSVGYKRRNDGILLSLLPEDLNSSFSFALDLALPKIEKIQKYTVSPYYATNTQQSESRLTLTSEEFAKAMKLYEESQYEEAIKIFKKGENDPDEDIRSSVNVFIGHSYLAMKKLAEAVEAFKKVTSEKNQDANYYFAFGSSLYLSGSPEEGIKMLRKSAEMGDEDAKKILKLIEGGN